MQHTEKKTLSGYRHHVKAALAALLLCLAVPAAAADKADAPAPMLSTPTSNGGQQAFPSIRCWRACVKKPKLKWAPLSNSRSNRRIFLQRSATNKGRFRGLFHI